MKHIKLNPYTFVYLVLFAISGTMATAQPKQSYSKHSSTAHHQVALEVLQASKKWINAFNKGKADKCVRGYKKNAVMRAMPFGVKKGTKAINDFWTPFIASGARNLEYTNVSIEVINKNTALLAANWRMNVGEGKIYQEKWIKENGRWLLAYDDFEVLKKYPAPVNYQAKPTASHVVLEKVLKASIHWINGFNNQNAVICGKGYITDATMNATPFASLHTQAGIQGFWAKLIKDGARNLIYDNLTITATSPRIVKLSARWSMNIGEGKIYQEKWVKNQNVWSLGYDEFEVLRQY